MLPLENHTAFRTTTIDQLCEAVESRLGAVPVELPGTAAPNEAMASYCKLPEGALWGCAYGLPVTLKFPDSDYIRLQFRTAGSGQVTMGGGQVAVTAETACLSSAAASIDFGAGYQQLVWRIPKAFLVRKLAALTGGALSGGLSFDPTIDLTTAEGESLRNMVMCLAACADNAAGPAADMMLTELEQAVAVALLCVSDHNHRHLLDQTSAGAASWQVRKVESYIDANWNQSLRMEDIVAVTGASARSIFRSFAEHRGYSPMEFLKRVRLTHARDMLASGDPALNVTDVALSCGFADLSRFSKDFRSAFGELPSTALNRLRRGAICAAGSPIH
jgi:AraC-like DNA-binding protein